MPTNLIIKVVLGSLVIAAAFAPLSANAIIKRPTHSPAAGHAIGGASNDGGGYILKNGRIKRVPPMAPVIPNQLRR